MVDTGLELIGLGLIGLAYHMAKPVLVESWLAVQAKLALIEVLRNFVNEEGWR